MAFHPLPTAHPCNFATLSGARLQSVSPDLPLPWVAHPVSGLRARRSPPRGTGEAPCSDSPSLRVRPLPALTPAPRNSPAHSSIGTRSARAPRGRRRASRRPWADGFGTVSLPSPGCFSPFPRGTRALSVARRIEPWTVVGPASRGVPRAPRYSRRLPERPCARRYGALTRCGAPSQALRLAQGAVTLRGPGRGLRAAVQPPAA